MKFWAFVVGAAPLDPELEDFWRRLGFLVIQGYGLTETAPIVTLNHPFHAKSGTVGKPIAGVEVKIAPDGEILVRGDNVTTGYINAPGETAAAFADGWFHTGDIGAVDEAGRLQVRGRLKEMIVTADGLNVFPEDVERVLDRITGVGESAVVGTSQGTEERVHAVLVLRNGADPEEIIRQANELLERHQRIRAFSVWDRGALPRTAGTRKLKRREVQQWVLTGGTSRPPSADKGEIESVLARYAPNRNIAQQTTIEELGLSSLERVELLMVLEQRFGTTIDEAEFTASSSIADLYRMLGRDGSPAGPPHVATTEILDFPRWNRGWFARVTRRINLPTWVLPLARVFCWVGAEGLENLRGIEPPVIFAANHQSHLDVPSLFMAMPAKWRYRAAPAMSKEFFHAHFFPRKHSWREWFTNSLNYYLACLVFNAFPLPQREAGARQTIRYAGELTTDGWCVLIFPEGKISETGDVNAFQPGVGMLASRLNVPVVPVRIRGLYDILRKGWNFPTPGRVRVTFGKPLELHGDDYSALARQVEDAVRAL
jgi:long-chain acyl-CoA synthetase